MQTRKAVSVVLTRDADSSDVYVVERSPDLKFFGGYYAFPGGTLDNEDSLKQVEIKNATSLPEADRPYIVAAVREVFEETGLLLSRGEKAISAEDLSRYRRQLLKDEIPFGDILQKERQVIDAADFHFICSIVTPKFAPVRYDTQFYWVEIPASQSPEIWPGELMRGEFCTAAEALLRWKKGDMLIVPPVIFMMQELVGRTIRKCVPFIAEYAEAYRKGKIHQVYFSPGVQLIPLQTRTIFPATHTNTYLVGESELYLVDPAPADLTEQTRLWDYLDDQLTEGRQLRGILLTHHHSDHVGALRACLNRYNLPLMAHSATVDKLSEFQFTGYLNHGDEIELGTAPDGQAGWKLQVYHTPGHAAGHLSFRESRYGALLVGDMISTLSTIVISPPEGHMATYLQSLQMLLSLPAGMLYPGHGSAVRNSQKVIQYYLHHRSEREQKLLRALTRQPQSSQELVRKVYDDVEAVVWPLAEHSLKAGLIKLIEEGKCQQIDDGYQLSTIGI